MHSTISSPANSVSRFELDDNLLLAYENTLQLKISRSRDILRNYSGGSIFGKLYLLHLNDALEVFITEDKTLYERFEIQTDARIDSLKQEDETAYQLFYLSEIKLQKSLVQLKFGDEFSAAWNFRQAYNHMKNLRKDYPDFDYNLKNIGLVHVIIGSAPDKYQWLLSILGFEGNVVKGLEELETFTTVDSPYKLQGEILLAFIHSYILQKHEAGLAYMAKYDSILKTNLLVNYVQSSLLIKASRNEEALRLLRSFEISTDYIVFPFIKYLEGTVQLQKGDYPQAIKALTSFLERHKGHNYIKDALFKMSIAYWLNGDETEASDFFELAKRGGSTLTEADKNADYLLTHGLPAKELFEVRLLTDGGYYAKADSLVSTLSYEDSKNNIELIYRKGRIIHKEGHPDSATSFYRKVIRDSEGQSWYFAPNSALQLGYIYSDLGKKDSAEFYFKSALKFKGHPYKSSIDNKARAALDELK